MPTARRGLVTATLNGLIFAIGGRSAGETNLATVETFSPLLPPLLTWGTAPSLPAPRAFASGAAVINGKIYVPGGLNAQASATKSLFVNDGATNSWSTKAPLPVASYGGAAAAINGKLYVFTPSGQGGYLHRYDPGTNTWTQRAAPPHAHLYAASGVINGKFYLAGGQEPNGTATSIVDVYNPATNQWTPKASMPTPRGFLSAANANGLLFALGGRSGNTVLKTNEAYSP